jgi:pyruvate formate lyase activating enzyme
MEEYITHLNDIQEPISCETCEHFCTIEAGRTGICGVRFNDNGTMKLLNYGKIIALHNDPIEKKPLFHFHPGTMALSLGALGCNMRCGNCQNYDISQIFGCKSKVSDYDKIKWGQDVSPEQVVEVALQHKSISIAYTYTEPTIFFEYALDVMRIAKEKGIKNVWVSNGFMSEKTLKAIAPYLDAINIDVKSFHNDFYSKNCGARLDPILRNCKLFVEKGVWLEITTLAIPTMSDNASMFHDIARFIKNELGAHVPWHISAFSGAISWKLQDLPSTTVDTIRMARDIGKEEGLHYVYGGNVPDPDFETTSCPNCSTTVVERIGYTTKRHDKEGHCPSCATLIDGRFI